MLMERHAFEKCGPELLPGQGIGVVELGHVDNSMSGLRDLNRSAHLHFHQFSIHPAVISRFGPTLPRLTLPVLEFGSLIYGCHLRSVNGCLTDAVRDEI